MKIVALDGHTLNPGDNPWNEIEKLGELVVYPRTDAAEIPERAGEAEIVITNKAPLDAGTIDRLEKLRFITVTATGYNIIDVEAARNRGIPVSNVPGYSSDAVAQHTFALLLELTNQVGQHHRAVQDGEWTACPDFSFTKVPLVELAGKTLGLVCFGDIGRRVARIALAMGMNVLACTRTRRDPIDDEHFAWADRSELFSQSDVVSLHCPQTSETAGMVNAALLRTMKPNAFLINTARGGLIVEEDLADALRAGKLAGAAVDVAGFEPIAAGNPLLKCPNCLITPHIAWATLEARKRLMRLTAENIAAFQKGRPIHVINARRP